MTAIQQQIVLSIEAMGDKSKFTDSILAKKLREIAKIESKKKAVLTLEDICAAINDLSEKGKFYCVTVTNANDLLIEKSDSLKEIPLESKQRRQRHEKSLVIFTSNDLVSSNKKSSEKKHKNNRTERKSLDVNKDYFDED